MRFVGRRRELQALERLRQRHRAQLVLMYGPRRVGKSYLLQRWIADRPAVFYQATQQAEAVELAAFSDAVRSLVKLPSGVNFPTWESALGALSDTAQSEPLIVVLDEFPNLCESTPGLASSLQRWWDLKGRTSRLMLILCGSAQTFMEELDTHAAALYGRFTAKMPIRPLSYREAAEFVPGLPHGEQAMVYGMLGGMPYALDHWDVGQTLRENIVGLFGDSLSPLIDAPDRMLTTTLADPKAAYRICRAIAVGKTRWAEIRDYAKVHDRAITQLVAMELVERRVPITEDADRSRRSTYRIPDPNLRFWFRYVLPYRGQIERGLGLGVVENRILPFLDDHMGIVYEDIARQFAGDLVAHGALAADGVGFWHSSDGRHEIDIVGVVNHEPTFVGTVKWQKTPLDRRVIANLEAHAQALQVPDDIPRLLIGRSGLAPEAQGISHVYGFSIDDIYAPIETAAARIA